MRNKLYLCADDYAISPSVSRGIRELIAAGRISGTSVMSNSEFWPADAKVLKALSNEVAIGLHITLTDQVSLAHNIKFAPNRKLPSFKRLCKLVYTRRIAKEEIELEVRNQFISFAAHFGRPPAYIDGHHHVHQLPIICDAVLKVIEELHPDKLIPVRSCCDNISSIFLRNIGVAKSLSLNMMGRKLKAKLRQSGLVLNDSFAGAYNLTSQGHYNLIFPRFLRHTSANHLIMCHPGYVDGALIQRDSYTRPREVELQYFLSNKFNELVLKENFDIINLHQLFSEKTIHHTNNNSF